MNNQFEGTRFRHILGKKIKKLRTKTGKTQVELATELGFTSTGAISQVENGLKGLKVESIVKAAEVLGVHPIVLITPYELGEEEIEISSELFMLFEKHKRSPEQFWANLQEVRKLLLRLKHESS